MKMPTFGFRLRHISKSPVLRGLGRWLKTVGAVQDPPPKVVKERYEEVVFREAPRTGSAMSHLQQGNRISRDMQPGFLRLQRTQAVRAFLENPIAKRAIKLRRSFVCQEGFKLESHCGNPIVQKFLDEHWDINWAELLKDRVDSLSVLGELCFYVPAANGVNGHRELSPLDIEQIEKIEPSPRNAERRGCVHFNDALKITEVQPDGQVTTRQQRQFQVLHYNWLTREYEGEVLFLGVNGLATMMRGVSDLTPVLDWLEAIDQLTYTEVERMKLMRNILWQRKMAGLKPEEVEIERQRWEANPPPPGSTWHSNEHEELIRIVPVLNVGESLELLKYPFGIAWGGLELPEHFYFSAGDVNCASASEMDDPVYAGFRDRKTDIAKLIAMDGQIAVDRARRVPGHDLRLVPADQLGVKVTSRDPERNAYDIIGQHLQSLAAALIAAEAQGWISNKEAGKQFRDACAARGLGEIPAPEEEVDQVAASHQAARKVLQLRRPELQDQYPLAPGGKADWFVRGTPGRGREFAPDLVA